MGIPVVVFKTGAVNEVLVKPECVELTEECREESGVSEEALSTAAPLEQALNQVGKKENSLDLGKEPLPHVHI